jgi:sugar/nucleoside kinase (ribokinase family)
MLLWSAEEHPDPAEAISTAATGPWVVVTDGPRPIVVNRPDGSTLQVVPQVHTATDTTGAGDLFAAAVTAGLGDGLEPMAALEQAADVAARYVATGRKGQIPRLTTMDS